ncbi:MAG: hydrogenase maturation protease [Spirochaetales bacterium]|nr:hydrogenase maturation protease [Spirochaetales bacterium]
MNTHDSLRKQYLVCGLGNPVLTDDAIGILLVRQLMKECDAKIRHLLDFKENQTGFMDLLEDFEGYKHILLIDSIETPTEQPGTLILCNPGNWHGLSYRSYASVHGLNFPTILELGRVLGNTMPETCTIAGITVRECTQFGMVLSAELQEEMPGLLSDLMQFIAAWVEPEKEELIYIDKKDHKKNDRMC